jgi:general nucleoside transport system permease protein
MLGFKLEKTGAPFWMKLLVPVVAIVVSFIITSGLVLLANVDPFQAIYYFLFDPLKNRVGQLEVLVKATPLLLTGISVAFAFSAGYYNIGAEGQLYAGAIAAAGVGMWLSDSPFAVTFPAMLIGGFAAGAFWAAIPAILKVKLQVDEVVTTLLLNSVILYVVSALLNGPWRDPVSGWPHSMELSQGVRFLKLIPRSRLHVGFLVAVAAVLIYWFIRNHTSFGLKMRAVGLGKEAARFAGIKVGRTMFMAAIISGGVAGLAGVGEVAGIHFYLIGDLSGNVGYTGILAATMGGLNAFGIAAASLFIGLIDTGAQSVSRSLGMPIYLGDVVKATMLLVTIGMLLLNNYRIRRS